MGETRGHVTTEEKYREVSNSERKLRRVVVT